MNSYILFYILYTQYMTKYMLTKHCKATTKQKYVPYSRFTKNMNIVQRLPVRNSPHSLLTKSVTITVRCLRSIWLSLSEFTDLIRSNFVIQPIDYHLPELRHVTSKVATICHFSIRVSLNYERI